MNIVKSEKLGMTPNDIEKNSLSGERFKILFNFKRIEQSKNIGDGLDRYDQKKYVTKKKNYVKI